MTAPFIARRLVERYGVAGAKRKVWHRLLHWTINGQRTDPVTQYVHSDFWMRVGRRVGNA